MVQDAHVSVDSNITIPNSIPPFPSTIPSLSQMAAQRTPYVHPLQTLSTLPSLSSNTRRRVSFETPASEEAVPPSPNTRSKNFNFTPISPGPHSPNGLQSKCSSTSASPFVSPRNTPVPRTKNTTHQNAGIMLPSDNRKHVKVKKELDLSLEIPPDVQIKNYMPMSAPVSPMLSNNTNTNKSLLLQKLLNASSKVEYASAYALAQNLPQAVDSPHFFPDLSSRSQSVPLSQMQAAGFTQLGSSSQIISAIMKTDPEFHSIPDQASENVKRILNSFGNQPCDNNNIDAFNLDMSSSNQCLTEYGLNLINTCSESDFTPYTQTQKIRNITRSQSIDIDVDFDVSKCNPSRSVPSTPLPFTQNVKINVIDDKNLQTSSRSYPSTPLNSNETFVYQVKSDCLLNGQPIRTESSEFMSNFEINSETNVSQLDNDFGIIENSDPLMDESGIF